MRNKIMLVIAALFFLAGCIKNGLKNETNNQAAEKAFKDRVEKRDLLIAKIRGIRQNQNTQSPAPENAGTCNKVVVCHKGNYISVNKNAVAAHMAHGDQLSFCATSCINQSVALLNSGPFDWYYDSYANDCMHLQHHHGVTRVAIGYGHRYIAAESFTQEREIHYVVYTYDHHTNTFLCIDFVDPSVYECAKNYLQSYIAANSCIPDLCTLPE